MKGLRYVLAASLMLASRAGAGVWQFTDVTDAAGLHYEHGYRETDYSEPRFIAPGVAAGDYDGDGWVDLYIARGDIAPNLLFRNRGDGSFEEAGAAAGIAIEGMQGAGPTFADFDGDGWLDLLLLGVSYEELPSAAVPRLFRNRGDGTFADVTAASGIVATRDSFSAAFGDYDRDGDLDVFITHWGTELGETLAMELLWRNNGDGSFTDVSLSSGIGAHVTHVLESLAFDVSFTPNFADIDSDGWADILLAADFGGSRVLLNNRDGTFRNATTGVISDENGMGGAVGDYDNDGDLDWFVSSVYDRDGPQGGNWGVTGNRLYQNGGDGTFTDVTDVAGVRDGWWGWASAFADFNNDGHLDLVHVNGWGRPESTAGVEFRTDPLRLFVANRDGTFNQRAEELRVADTGQGRGLVTFDYDRDGDLDLFVTNNGQPPHLYRNDGGNAGTFLHLDLVGRAPNTEAIGARIYVSAGGRTQLRELRAGSNFMSQDPATAHFGLGASSSADEVRIEWPDGEMTNLGRVRANQFLAVAHPRLGACTAPGASNPCVAGGGRLRADDCHLEWLVTPAPAPARARAHRSALRCVEGDAACDADPDVTNGRCTFQAALCINNIDPRLIGCVPSGVAAFELVLPRAASSDASDVAIRADLEAAAGAGADGLGLTVVRTGNNVNGSPNRNLNRCSGTVELPVSVGVDGAGLGPGRKIVRATVTAPSGERDGDQLVLECRPRPAVAGMAGATRSRHHTR